MEKQKKLNIKIATFVQDEQSGGYSVFFRDKDNIPVIAQGSTIETALEALLSTMKSAREALKEEGQYIPWER